MDRNAPIGRSRGVELIANFNLPKYPRDPATGVLHPQRNSYGSEPLKRVHSVCDAERFYNRRIPPARLSCYSVTAAMTAHFPTRTTHPANGRTTKRAEYIQTMGVFINNNGEPGEHTRTELNQIPGNAHMYRQNTYAIHYLRTGATNGHTHTQTEMDHLGL